MKLKIETFVVGLLQANCYVLWEPKTLEGVIIDPGDDAEKIINFVKKKKLSIPFILNTHGHIDHIGGNTYAKDTLHSKIGIHKLDAILLSNSILCGAGSFELSFIEHSPDFFLSEDKEIELSNFSIKTIHTPGHTQGGVCFFIKEDNLLFSGDTLFCGSVGRTDLPGGSWEQLKTSIEDKLFVLDENTLVFAGHGETTTIRDEKRNNPFFL